MTASPALAIPTRYNPLATHNKPTQVRDGNSGNSIHPSQVNNTETVVQMSQSNRLDDWRRNFAEVRKNFLRENYRNAEEVAVVYGVRFQSALNWWNGDNAASGAFVAHDFRLHPQSAARHYGTAA
jgi:hypothetical protein